MAHIFIWSNEIILYYPFKDVCHHCNILKRLVIIVHGLSDNSKQLSSNIVQVLCCQQCLYVSKR